MKRKFCAVLAMALCTVLIQAPLAGASELPKPQTIPDPAPSVGMADPALAMSIGRGAADGIYSDADISTTYLSDPDFSDSTQFIHPTQITAIGEVLEDGLVIAALRIRLDDSVPAGLLTPTKFQVPGRKVVHSYVNDTGVRGEIAQQGSCLFLELLVNETPDSNEFKETSGQYCFGPDSTRTWAIDLPMWTSVRLVNTCFTPEGKAIAPFNMVNDDQYIEIVDRMVPGSYTDPKTGVTIEYNLFVPAGYEAPDAELAELPIVLFLHGAGESGYDNRATLTAYRQGEEYMTPEAQAETPAFVLVPQCPMTAERGQQDYGITGDTGGWYTYIDSEDGNTYTYPTQILEAVVNTLTDDVMPRYSIDENRVYVTGHSMGGGGSAIAMANHPEVFAAVASFASVAYMPDELLKTILDKPMLFTMGENDNVDRIRSNMPLMMDQLERLGGKVYRAVGDEAWDAFFRGEQARAQGEATLARAAEAGDNIVFIEYMRGSVLSVGHLSHRASFENAAIRHWMFAQVKGE